jgi:fatty acid/phospholipid biosynthesis enzyme
MKIKTPDIYIKPELIDVGILDFHKANLILKSVENDVNILKNALEEEVHKRPTLRELGDNLKDMIKGS